MSRCSYEYPATALTTKFLSFWKSAIWSCACGSIACPSPAFMAWKRAFVSAMKRNTTRSSFIGAIVNFGFFTTVICVPFCQLWNFQGPLETGIESSHSLFASLPTEYFAGQTPLLRRVTQSAYTFLKVTMPVLPLQLTDLMSS